MNQDNFNEFALIELREIAKDLRAIRLLMEEEKAERHSKEAARDPAAADEYLNAVFGSNEKEEERTLNKFLDIVCAPR